MSATVVPSVPGSKLERGFRGPSQSIQDGISPYGAAEIHLPS
jgi:hypothetical protein